MNEENNSPIQVTTEARYLPEQSQPDAEQYAFGYTITIHNAGTVPAKLTHRHWLITDSNGKVEEVHGKGVIGKQPKLEPGASFRYTSGVVLNTPVGAMQGYYDMTSDDGEAFKAPIAPFGLSVPGSLH